MAQDWDQYTGIYNEESGISFMAHEIIEAHIDVDSTVDDVKAITETMTADFCEDHYEWLIGYTIKRHDGTLTWNPEWGGWTDVKGSDEFFVYPESGELRMSLQKWDGWEAAPKNRISLVTLAAAVAAEILRQLP